MNAPHGGRGGTIEREGQSAAPKPWPTWQVSLWRTLAVILVELATFAAIFVAVIHFGKSG